MPLRGKFLDEAVEAELLKMLRAGYDQAPISNKALHTRLKNKGCLSGGINSLSRFSSRISEVKAEQLLNAGIEPEEQLTKVNPANKAALKKRIKLILKKNSVLEEQNKFLLSAFCELISVIETQTPIPTEHLLETVLFKTGVEQPENESAK